MEGLKPVLFGLTTTNKLWPLIHPPLLFGWGPLLLAPRWKHTKKLTLLLPLLHGLLYSAVFLPMMLSPTPDGQPEPDISSMQSIFSLFGDPDIFFCGWVHYLSFDLLVARGIAEDALEVCKVSNFQYYAMVVPCLFACFYCGPVGFVAYMVFRAAVFSGSSSKQM